MKLFKDGLLRANMKKVLLAIVAFILVTSVITLLCVAAGSYLISDSTFTGVVFAPGMMAGYLFLSIGCYSMSISLFGYLMKRNESDFYGVLPYKRKTMFRKNMIAIYIVLGVILVVNIFVLLVSSFFVRAQVSIVWKDSFKYIMAAVIAMILIANISAFAMSCSGNLRTAFLMTALLIFGPRILITSVVYTGNVMNGAMNIAHLVWFLNPDINLVSRGLVHFMDNGIGNVDSMRNISIWAASAYTAVLAGIYFILGERAYVNRDSEMAGTGSIGRVTYFFNKIFLGVLIMLIPICGNISGPDLKRVSGVNEVQILVFVAISILVMFFWDAYIGRKGKRLVNLLYSSGAVAICSLVIILVILGIKKYEWNYRLDPDKIEGFNIAPNDWLDSGNNMYTSDVWVKPDSETAKLIAKGFEAQIKKVYAVDAEGNISWADGRVKVYAYTDKLGVEHTYSHMIHYDMSEEIQIRYKGKNMVIRVDDFDPDILPNIQKAFFNSETYVDASYKIPNKITPYNGKAIAIVTNCDMDINIDSKGYSIFKDEYYKLYDEYKKKDELKDFCNASMGVVLVGEELVDGYSRCQSVNITKEEFPKTYAYVWKRYVESYYDTLKTYVEKVDKGTPIKAYVNDSIKDGEEVDITYDQLLKILEAKDKEPKYIYTVVIGKGSNERAMYISSSQKLD